MFMEYTLRSLFFIGFFFLVSSCAQLRYTDYGKPFDFLKAQKVTAVSFNNEKPKSNKEFDSSLGQNKQHKNPESFKEFNSKNTPENFLLNSTKLVLSESLTSQNKVDYTIPTPQINSSNGPNSFSVPYFSFIESDVADNKNFDDTDAIILTVLCLLIPPLAVFVVYDISTEFWIDLILTMCFFIPGVIYAFYLCFVK